MTEQRKATLRLGENTEPIEFPILSGNMGPDTVDIRTLYAKTGLFTYDPGFLSTASTKSSITFIDGDKGILLYRGYAIEQLAARCDFMEVCHLLLTGELPTDPQKQHFVSTIKSHTMLHEQLVRFYTGFRRDAHPMAVMVGVVGALSAFYHEAMDISDVLHREQSAFRLIAKLHTIAAMAYKYNIGQPFIYSRNDLSYAANFLHMMFATPAEKYEPNPVIVRALDRILILHADHEIADAFGIGGGTSIASYTYACAEDNAGDHTNVKFIGPLLCSNYAGCPMEHLTNMDQLGVACGPNSRRSLCPCQ